MARRSRSPPNSCTAARASKPGSRSSPPHPGLPNTSKRPTANYRSFALRAVSTLASHPAAEQRSGTTLLAAPHRSRVLAAKSAVAGAYGGLLVLLGAAGARGGEGILPAVLHNDGLTRWTPNGAAGALVGIGAHPLTPGAAGLLLAGYTTAISAVASVL